MLFLLGARLHPIFRVLVGAILLAVGAILTSKFLIGIGVLGLLYGGFTWYRRARTGARQQEARLHKEGAAR